MTASAFPFEILYDGQCRICLFDVAWMKRLDRRGRLQFTDVSHPGFSPETYGTTRAALLARMHGRRADGELVEGAEVFRLAWTALGYGLLVAPTRWPGLRQCTDGAYLCFARHRLALSRRFGGLFARITPDCDDRFCQR
jgi:predicted DCC family thiol-disulfide oxidoreductase YuxK